MKSFNDALTAGLATRRENNRYRHRRTLETPQQVLVKVDGRELLNFCSNDYLGLANHTDLIQAANKAMDKFGLGGGASHLVCGHSVEHHALEEELADFCGRDRALLFSTGYMANVGVLQALLGRHDTLFEDKLNHASILDGAVLSRAKRKRYRHVDLIQLEEQLTQSNAKRKLLATDGVFSMDGDCAPLVDMAELAKKHDAVLMVDDAHGFGCLGKNGAGLQESLQLNQDALPVLVGTLGKAFGSFGAFVAGSDVLIETLIQFSRSYIYTTSMPPSVAAASRASLKRVIHDTWRRDKLMALIALFKSHCEQAGIQLMPSDTPIQPVMIGSEKNTLALSESLKKAGFWVSAIRPPTVPEGTSRLRITLTAAHTEVQIEQLVDALNSGVRKLQSVNDEDLGA